MSLINRLLQPPERRVLTSLQWQTDQIPSNGQVGYIDAGVAVSDTTSLQLLAFYACINLLANNIAQLPWDAYRKRGEVREPVAPESTLLRDPYVELTDFEWKHIAIVSLAMRGNFYGHVVARDWLEYPVQVMPLHPDAVRPERDRETGVKRFRVGGDLFPASDILHIRWFTLPGSDEGLSPVSYARQTIGLGLAAQQFGARWFGDGAAPSSQITTEQDVNDNQAKAIQRRWIDSHGGRRKPAVMGSGFKWEPISITPEESQFIETRKFSRSEMAMMFGVPPHMIGDVEKSTSWGTGIEQQSIGFVTYTLGPWLTRLEAALSRLLPRGQFVKFNVAGLLRGDIKSRYDAYQVALDAGWRNPDEIRSLEDLPPIPGGAGQGFRQPLNFGPLGAEPEPPAPPPPENEDDDDDEP